LGDRKGIRPIKTLATYPQRLYTATSGERKLNEEPVNQATASDNTYRKCREVSYVWFLRNISGQTDKLIAILCTTHTGGKVITLDSIYILNLLSSDRKSNKWSK